MLQHYIAFFFITNYPLVGKLGATDDIDNVSLTFIVMEINPAI